MNQRTKKTRIHVLCLLMSFVMVTGMIAGCGGQEGKKDSDGNNPSTSSPENDKGQKTDAEGKSKLKLSLFEGGLAGAWEEVLPLFEKAYPQYEIEADISPDNHERLRANLVAGTPPDVAAPNIVDFNLYVAAFSSGQFMDISDLVYNQPVEWAPGKTYADLFFPEDLALVTDPDGKMNLALLSYSLEGWFYNKALFREKGWAVPHNWDEFLALSEKIKAEGISPFTYQGMFPPYLTWGYLLEAIAAAGEGRKTFLDAFYCQKDGVWEDRACLKAATQLYDMALNDCILKGTTALTHTEAQMEFLNGSVAFIPCGQWFENEMKSSLPEDFELGFTLVPVQNKNGENYISKTPNFFGIPKDAKNPKGGADFIKFIYTPEVQQIFAKHGMIPFVKELDKDAMSMFTPHLQECLDVATGKDPEFPKLSHLGIVSEQLFPTLWSVIGDQLTLLVMGEITPEKFCKAVEAEADRIRADDSITKIEFH